MSEDITAAQLRTWRKTLKLTQPTAARALRVSYRTYQRWESGEVDVPGIVGPACIGAQYFVAKAALVVLEDEIKKNPPGGGLVNSE